MNAKTKKVVLISSGRIRSKQIVKSFVWGPTGEWSWSWTFCWGFFLIVSQLVWHLQWCLALTNRTAGRGDTCRANTDWLTSTYVNGRSKNFSFQTSEKPDVFTSRANEPSALGCRRQRRTDVATLWSSSVFSCLAVREHASPAVSNVQPPSSSLSSRPAAREPCVLSNDLDGKWGRRWRRRRTHLSQALVLRCRGNVSQRRRRWRRKWSLESSQ